MAKSSYELYLEQLRDIHFQLGLLDGYFKSEYAILEYDRKNHETDMNQEDLNIIKAFSKCRSILFNEIYLPMKSATQHSEY